MPKKLKLWNGRGDQRKWDHYCVAAYTKKQAAELIARHENPWATGERSSELTFFVNRALRKMKDFFSPCWGTEMRGITPEVGLWGRPRHCGPYTRIT